MDTCPHNISAKLPKHGLTRNGKQRYFCPDCLSTSRPAPDTNTYDGARKAEISLWGLTRIFGVSRQTVTA